MSKNYSSNGGIKPAEIAAATPQPMKMSFDKSPGILLLIKFPIVPPRWTNGPYCPTDAPPLAEIKAEMLKGTLFSYLTQLLGCGRSKLHQRPMVSIC